MYENVNETEMYQLHSISVCDVHDNYSRTMSSRRSTRLQTLSEEPELEWELQQEQEMEQHQRLEMKKLLRNSWTLSATNTSRMWLLRTGNTS